LEVPLLSDYITAMTEGFNLKLADVWEPLVKSLGKHQCWQTAVWSYPLS